ncbi:hypothetical protein AB0L06_43335 [Spirillospora sp. NPDC052269]
MFAAILKQIQAASSTICSSVNSWRRAAKASASMALWSSTICRMNAMAAVSRGSGSPGPSAPTVAQYRQPTLCDSSARTFSLSRTGKVEPPPISATSSANHALRISGRCASSAAA